MNRFALLGWLALMAANVSALAQQTTAPAPRPDLSKVTIPDDRAAAVTALKEWLVARGIDVEERQGAIILKRAGLMMNVQPIPTVGEIDRVRVSAFFFPKDEFRGKKEFEDLGVKLNRSQNFLQVFIADDGNLGTGGSITFVDELSAKVFDAYVDAFVQIVKRFVLTEEALTMLK